MYGQHGHIGAVNALQQQIGRRLDIVHTYLRQPAPFPTASDLAFVRQGSTLLVSWALNDSRGIAAGQYDASIRQRARELKALGKPVFLEWRWEMDRPNIRFEVGSPADYIAAWKHIRLIFAAAARHERRLGVVPHRPGFASGNAAGLLPGQRRGGLGLRRRLSQTRDAGIIRGRHPAIPELGRAASRSPS